MENIVINVLSLLGGGALATIITALVNRKKTDADAQNLQIQTLLLVDERLSAKIAEADVRIKNLEDEKRTLEGEVLELKEQYLLLKVEFEKIKGDEKK